MHGYCRNKQMLCFWCKQDNNKPFRLL